MNFANNVSAIDNAAIPQAVALIISFNKTITIKLKKKF